MNVNDLRSKAIFDAVDAKVDEITAVVDVIGAMNAAKLAGVNAAAMCIDKTIFDQKQFIASLTENMPSALGCIRTAVLPPITGAVSASIMASLLGDLPSVSDIFMACAKSAIQDTLNNVMRYPPTDSST